VLFRSDWTLVKTEVEALQLEFTWIKQYSPDFNVQFKDDKSYPHLAIDLNSEFPRLFISRSKKIPGVRYFGPYSHAWALRSTFETLIKIYPVRTCSESNFQSAVRSKRQCLLGDIGKCAAPCVNWVSPDEHRKLANDLVNFLEKSPEDISTRIENEMKGLEWGRLYETYHSKAFDPAVTAEQVSKLYADPFLKNRKGIYEYVLGGLIDSKLIDVRVFDESTKRATYEKQTLSARAKDISNCPLCAIGNEINENRIWSISDMDADHITAWSRGGATVASNCEMLCKTHNRSKGNR
jgi:5-methylcytosine-specific restriction endonuclease McrA